MLRRPPRSTRTDTTLSLHDALPIYRICNSRICTASLLPAVGARSQLVLSAVALVAPPWPRHFLAVAVRASVLVLIRHFGPAAHQARLNKFCRSQRRQSLEPKAGFLACVDRKSVVVGKSVSVRVDLGGGRIIKKK